MDYNRLSQQARIEAKARAGAAVAALAGVKPTPEQFHNSGYSKYPAWLIRVVLGLAGVMFMAAFLPSAFRLYYIGHETFGHSIGNPALQTVVGVCIVLLAETGTVLFTLALAVLPLSRTTRLVVGASIVGTVAIALAGNFYVGIWGKGINVFVVLEAMLPPLLTLGTAYVLKEVTLQTIAARHADNLAYEAALRDWQAAAGNPEQHSAFGQAYANEIWGALVKANRRESVRSWLLSLSPTQKSALVRREMREDSWFSAESADEAGLPDTEPVQPVDMDEVDEAVTTDFLATSAT